MTSRRTKLAALKALWTNAHVRRGVTALFLLVVAALIFNEARTVEWKKVALAIKSYEAVTLAIAAACSALGYLIYSCYDLLGRAYTNVKLPKRTMMSAAFVSFATNQSLGSLIGSVGFRFRIYSKLGLPPAQIARITGLSIVTNWLGYAALAGAIFVSGALALPKDIDMAPGWELGRSIVRGVGIALLLSAAAYIAMCAFSRKRQFTIRKIKITIPSSSLAFAQLGLSAIHWPVAAAIVYVLFQGQVAFVLVLAALLLAAIAVVLTHIPAGLGVLEAVFIGLLSRRIPTPHIVAALLVFRAIYYLAPLAIAAVVYMTIETAKKTSETNESESRAHGEIAASQRMLSRVGTH